MDKPLFGTLPASASDVAAHWDTFYIFLCIISLFFFVLCIGGMVYFSWIYRKGRPGKTSTVSHNTPLEVIWTVIPTILLMIVFGWGWVLYKEMVHAPADSMEVRVLGKQWLWQFQYEDGRVTTGDLFVPVNQPVKLVMSSEDVLHSFFIPDFRVKQDVVPGMFTSVWFEAKEPGMHQVYCTEYCGAAHSGMLAKVYALSEEDWKLWKRGKEIKIPGMEKPIAKSGETKRVSLASAGEKIVKQYCTACHTTDGTKRLAPTFKGIYGSKEELTDGTTVTVDDNYIRESIEAPATKVTKGYSPIMPSFKGQLSEEQISQIIMYIKSLK